MPVIPNPNPVVVKIHEGSPGPAGPTGAAGLNGEDGAQGIQGEPGEQGPPGPTLEHYDTAANLASLNPVVGEGNFAYAWDTEELRIGNGIDNWLDLPNRAVERADVEVATSTVAQATISTATDITSLTVTFTVGARPWKVYAVLPWVVASAAAVTCSALITDESNNLKAMVSETSRGTSDLVGLPQPTEIIVTPGTYTRKVRMQTNAGTLTNNANLAYVVAVLIAEEM